MEGVTGTGTVLDKLGWGRSFGELVGWDQRRQSEGLVRNPHGYTSEDPGSDELIDVPEIRVCRDRNFRSRVNTHNLVDTESKE